MGLKHRPKLKKWLNSKSKYPLNEDRPSNSSRFETDKLLYPFNPNGLSTYELQRLREYVFLPNKNGWTQNPGNTVSPKMFKFIMSQRSVYKGAKRWRKGMKYSFYGGMPAKYISDISKVKYLTPKEDK